MSFLTFEDRASVRELGMPGRWTVQASATNERLGWIEYDSALRRYVFATTGAYFDATCLQEIALFLARESKR